MSGHYHVCKLPVPATLSRGHAVTLPRAALETRVGSEDRRTPASAGHRGTGIQNRPDGHGVDLERDL